MGILFFHLALIFVGGYAKYILYVKKIVVSSHYLNMFSYIFITPHNLNFKY